MTSEPPSFVGHVCHLGSRLSDFMIGAVVWIDGGSTSAVSLPLYTREVAAPDLA